MRLAFSATNPCHLFPLAVVLHDLGCLDRYFSGYPKWKLFCPSDFPIETFSARTLLVYGALKFSPPSLRPRNRSLFLWQDQAFDRAVAQHLCETDFLHGLPGQCLETFKRAKSLGIKTVLNHATNPAQALAPTLDEEYRRIGLNFNEHTVYDDAFLDRTEEEYALADFHCVSSTIVRDALINQGVAPSEILLVPYGADTETFKPRPSSKQSEKPFRLIFAGELTLRKGIRFILEALEQLSSQDLELHFYGRSSIETQQDFENYSGTVPIFQHGPVSQQKLAEAFQESDLCLLPSLEEGFGLVVPQSLNCGTPCLVSSSVGAKDLIEHRLNGSVVPAKSSLGIAYEITWWIENRKRLNERHDWKNAASIMLEETTRIASPNSHLQKAS